MSEKGHGASVHEDSVVVSSGNPVELAFIPRSCLDRGNGRREISAITHAAVQGIKYMNRLNRPNLFRLKYSGFHKR